MKVPQYLSTAYATITGSPIAAGSEMTEAEMDRLARLLNDSAAEKVDRELFFSVGMISSVNPPAFIEYCRGSHLEPLTLWTSAASVAKHFGLRELGAYLSHAKGRFSVVRSHHGESTSSSSRADDRPRRSAGAPPSRAGKFSKEPARPRRDAPARRQVSLDLSGFPGVETPVEAPAAAQ